jgi:hypothetical protein
MRLYTTEIRVQQPLAALYSLPSFPCMATANDTAGHKETGLPDDLYDD